MAETPDVVTKKGDRLPSIAATLTDDAGTAINLTGYTVKLKARKKGRFKLEVDTAAVVVDAAAGSVRYDPASVDVDEVLSETYDTAPYEFKWHLTETSTGKTRSVPANGWDLWEIQPNME